MFGTLYAIDEDACNLLQQYLDSMKRYFQSREGGDEIADDIEHHVAELLWKKKESGIEAIAIDDIRDIIAQIGEAKQIDSTSEENDGQAEPDGENSEEGAEGEASTTHHPSSTTHDTAQDTAENSAGLFQRMKENSRHRRLFRNPNDKLVGGILAGLATFTGVGTATGWRLLFTILFIASIVGGATWLYLMLFWGYIIMLFIVPTPKTPEDRLCMQGVEVTPENINQQILNDSTSATANYSQPSSQNNGCLSLFLKFILVLLLIPTIFIVGVMLFATFVAGAALFGMGATMFPAIFDEMHGGVITLIQDNQIFYIFGLIAALLVVILPIIWLYRIIRYHHDPEKKTYWWQILVGWLLCVVLSIVAGISFFMNVAKIENDYRRSQWNNRNAAKNIDIDEELIQQADSLASAIEAQADSLESAVVK